MAIVYGTTQDETLGADQHGTTVYGGIYESRLLVTGNDTLLGGVGNDVLTAGTEVLIEFDMTPGPSYSQSRDRVRQASQNTCLPNHNTKPKGRFCAKLYHCCRRAKQPPTDSHGR
jgi:hypothetical protein